MQMYLCRILRIDLHRPFTANSEWTNIKVIIVHTISSCMLVYRYKSNLKRLAALQTHNQYVTPCILFYWTILHAFQFSIYWMALHTAIPLANYNSFSSCPIKINWQKIQRKNQKTNGWARKVQYVLLFFFFVNAMYTQFHQRMSKKHGNHRHFSRTSSFNQLT